MDPVQQVLAQQSSGSADGASFIQSFEEGRRHNLSSRRVRMEERQEERNTEIHPLQMQALQYGLLNKALEAQVFLGKDALSVQMNSFLPRVQELLYRFRESPMGFYDKGLIAQYQQMYAQNPWAFSGGEGALIKQGMDAQVMQRSNWVGVIENDKRNREAMEEMGVSLEKFDPISGKTQYGNLEELRASADGVDSEIKNVTDPKTGRKHSFYRRGRNSWALVPERFETPIINVITDPRTGNPVSMVQTGLNSHSRVPQTPGETQLEKSELDATQIFEKGRQLLPMINERTTSGVSNLKRVLRDSKLGVFLPESFLPSAEVTEADAVAREFASSMVRGLRSDGNINEREFQALTTEANTLRWVNERTGKSRLKAFVQGAVRKAREATLKLGKPINEKYLTAEEIISRAEAKVESGEMTPEQAKVWGKLIYDDSAEAFIRDVDQQIGK
jgi:hypothetical protein